MNTFRILIFSVAGMDTHSGEHLLSVLTNYFVRKIYFIFQRSVSNRVWRLHITFLFHQGYLELLKVIIKYISSPFRKNTLLKPSWNLHIFPHPGTRYFYSITVLIYSDIFPSSYFWIDLITSNNFIIPTTHRLAFFDFLNLIKLISWKLWVSIYQ